MVGNVTTFDSKRLPGKCLVNGPAVSSTMDEGGTEKGIRGGLLRVDLSVEGGVGQGLGLELRKKNKH